MGIFINYNEERNYCIMIFQNFIINIINIINKITEMEK